jgi:putative ABC transport system permease protein
LNAVRAKIAGDLRNLRRRGLLAALAIAIGIAGFSAVLASYAILDRELDRGYRETTPASASFKLEGAADSALLAAVAANPKVARAEARRQLGGSISARPGRVRKLRLTVLPEFANLRIGRIASQAGAFPPAAGEILIERDAFSVLGGQIGDQVLVETKNGQGRLRVAGSVKDVGKAQARMENLVYGYVAAETLPLLGEQAFLDQIDILAAGDPFDEKNVRAAAAEVEAFLRGSGRELESVSVPEPGRHPHADLMAMLLLAMAAFGFFLLLLSGLLVHNLLSALVAAQVRQVAIMKTLGASARQIAAIYGAEVLALASAALAIGLPAGALGCLALCRYLARLLNFDIESFALPLWVPALVVLAGLLVPLLAAAWPIARTITRPVLSGLGDHGASASAYRAAGSGRPPAFALPRPLLFAWRNLFRRRARLVSNLFTLAAAGVFFLSALNLRRSLIATIDALFAARHFESAAEQAASRYSYDQHMLMIYVFLIVVAGLLAAVGGLGLATTTSLGVLERRREIGVLRAIGASPAAIRRIFLAEGAATGAFSWAVAVLLAPPVGKLAGGLIGRGMFRGMEFAIEPHGLWIWLLLAAGIGALAGYLPALEASRAGLRESLAYE